MFSPYEFDRPELPEDEFADGWKPRPKESARFAPKVLAAIHGKPLPDYTRDRVLEAERDEAGRFKPQSKKSKPMKETTQQPPAQEAGKAPEGIQSTKDYKQFKLLATNRPVDKAHVRALAAAIRKKNMLHLNPMTVTCHMEVVDGQHRLAAAELCGVSIFFVQDDHVTQNDIASLNSNKKNWGLMDYIHFYAEKGVREYEDAVEFCQEHPNLPANTLLSISTADGNLKRSYQDGILDISRMDVALDTVHYLSAFIPYTQFATTAKFIRALAFIVRTGLYDHAHMLKKLESVGLGSLPPQPQSKGWIEALERIYNKHVREENIVIFLKRR